MFNNLLGSLSSHALCCAFQRKHFLLDSIATYFFSFSWQTQACCYGCHPSSLTRRPESRIAAELGVSALQSTIPSNPKAGVENPTAKPMMVSQPQGQNVHYCPLCSILVPFLLPVILQRNIHWLLIVLSIAVVCIDVKHAAGHGIKTAVLQHAVTVGHVLMA